MGQFWANSDLCNFLGFNFLTLTILLKVINVKVRKKRAVKNDVREKYCFLVSFCEKLAQLAHRRIVLIDRWLIGPQLAHNWPILAHFCGLRIFFKKVQKSRKKIW